VNIVVSRRRADVLGEILVVGLSVAAVLDVLVRSQTEIVGGRST
jgi:hypothetical protein